MIGPEWLRNGSCWRPPLAFGRRLGHKVGEVGETEGAYTASQGEHAAGPAESRYRVERYKKSVKFAGRSVGFPGYSP